ncbi:hypothetical protein [Acidianus sp. RZ1]|uniref:hypothetical protein n=1 Tax=Acidianus sp. RZ1 TaxID=1540082 RepID=UPI0014924BE9|nr:hypothetical protein [Acidianus sp. RZ1]NON61520.1 hypothetical protein [Acidianus sp. RZ1]
MIYVTIDSIFDFSKVKDWKKINIMVSQLACVGEYKSFNEFFKDRLLTVNPFYDSYYLEELRYRDSLAIVSNLDHKTVENLLSMYNLDSFISRIITADMVKTFISRIFFQKLGRGVLITSLQHEGVFAKMNKLKVYFIKRYGENLEVADYNVESLEQIADFMSSHKIDKGLGDSHLRC